MKKPLLFSLTLFILIIPVSSQAFFNKAQDTVIVAEHEIIKGDYIKFANAVDIKGNVDGDVIALASSISVSGKVNGDVIAAGSDIKIGGEVFGSVRVVGENVEISGVVERNVNAYAVNVTLTETSEVQRNIYVWGGVVRAQGKTGGNLTAKAVQVILGGDADGDVYADIDEQGKLQILKNSAIGGNFTYKASDENQLEKHEEATIQGETTFQRREAETTRGFFQEFFTFGKIVSLFGMLVIGLLMVTLAPRAVKEIASQMQARPWKSMFFGFVIFAITPLVVFLLFFTLIGIPLALVLIPSYFIALYFGKVLSGIATGIFLTRQFNKKHEFKSLIWPMVLGMVILVMATHIGLVGWMVSVAAMMWGLGALFEFKKEILKQWR